MYIEYTYISIQYIMTGTLSLIPLLGVKMHLVGRTVLLEISNLVWGGKEIVISQYSSLEGQFMVGIVSYLVRMNATRSVKKIFEGKLQGRRDRGRPRLRWMNDAEDDLRKIGVKGWRMKALEREEWASIIKEAKAELKGP
jgi:hypothetical protein